MKRRLLCTVLAFVVLIPLFSALIPPPAQALAADPTNTNFSFYVPNSGTYLAQLQDAIKNKNNGDSSLAQTAIYVTGRIFGSNQVAMKIEPNESNCAQTSAVKIVSGCFNHDYFGGAQLGFGNPNLFVYDTSYTCDTGVGLSTTSGASDPNDHNDHYDVTFAVALSLGSANGEPDPLIQSDGSLNNHIVMHWAGFTTIEHYEAEQNGVVRPAPTNIDSADLPQGCHPPVDGIYSGSNATSGLDGKNVNQNIAVTSTLPSGATAPTNPTVGSNSTGSLSCNVPGISGLSLDPISDVEDGLNWLLCGIVQGAASLVNELDQQIVSWLTIGTNGQTNTDNPTYIFADKGYCSQSLAGGGSTCADYYSAWQDFELLALGLLAVICLMIIVAQALGIDMLDAYTIRKMLPRVVAGAIIVSISWPLMRFFVILSNDLGYGIQYLLYTPFGNLKDNITTLNIMDDMGFAIAGVGVGLFGLLTFVGMAALAVLVAFLTLVFRQIAVILLIIFAPIALICYALPNTQRVYKFWWESFSKLLLMFPLIVGMITIAHIFSALSAQTAAAASGFTASIDNLIAVIAYFAPYFMIPLTFRFSGAMMSTVGGAINQRAQGGYAFLSKKRKEHTAERMQKARDGNLWNKDFGRFGQEGKNRAIDKAYRAAHRKIYGKDKEIKQASIGRMGNRAAAWTYDADQLVPYHLGKPRQNKYGSFKGTPGVRRYSAGLAGRIGDEQAQQTAKRGAAIDGVQYKGLWALGGQYELLSTESQMRLANAGWGTLERDKNGDLVKATNALGQNSYKWKTKRLAEENVDDAIGLSEILKQSSDDKERQGGVDLFDYRGAVSTFSKPAEFRYANLTAAAALSAAKQSRGEDMPAIANMLRGQLGAEGGNRMLKIISDTESQSRVTSRYGYATVTRVNPETGEVTYEDTLSPENAGGKNAAALIDTLDSQRIARAKAEDIKKMEPAYLAQLAQGPQGAEIRDPATGQVVGREWTAKQQRHLGIITNGLNSVWGGDAGQAAAWQEVADHIRTNLGQVQTSLPNGQTIQLPPSGTLSTQGGTHTSVPEGELANQVAEANAQATQRAREAQDADANNPENR